MVFFKYSSGTGLRKDVLVLLLAYHVRGRDVSLTHFVSQEMISHVYVLPVQRGKADFRQRLCPVVVL